MMEFLDESAGKVIGVRATGTLTSSDYKEVFIPRLEKLFAEFGKLRILFYMNDGFVGWDLSVAWDDAALGLKHRAEFERIAVVGGPRWVGWCMRWTAFLIAGQIRTYSAGRLQDAWEWLKMA